MRLPPMPELPRRSCAAASWSSIDGAVLGSDERGAELLAGLRALRPRWTPSAGCPAKSLVRLHMDPEGGAPFASDSAMLASFPDAAVDAFLAEAGPDATTSLLMAELRQLGGALGRPHEGGGVLNRLDAQFVTFGGGIATTPEMGAQAHADAVRLTEALSPFANGRQYLNFAENPVDTRSAYGADVWTQLTGIRSAVDPHGVFVANHPVPRLFENGRPPPESRQSPTSAQADLPSRARSRRRCPQRDRDAQSAPTRRSQRARRAGPVGAGRAGLEPGLEAHQRGRRHGQLDQARRASCRRCTTWSG